MTRPWARTVMFLAAVALLAQVINQHDLANVLPEKLATEIGHNREALGLALIMVPVIQWFRPWAARRRHPMVPAVLLAAVLYGFGWWMLHESGWTSDYFTYSESFFGAAFITVYVQAKRPARWGLLVTPAVLASMVVWRESGWVLDQLEDLVMIMLAPLAFDLFDRRILDRSAPDRPGLRLGWCVGLVVLWFGLWRLAAAVRPDLHGPLDYTIDWGYRAAEAYWGILLIHLYFSYWLGRSWLDRTPNAADPVARPTDHRRRTSAQATTTA
jgi:hypothetical protein